MILAEYDEKATMEMLREEYREDAIAEGLAEGLAEGRAQGLAEGLAEGLAQGHAEVLKILGLTPEQYEEIAKAREADPTKTLKLE